MAGLRLRRIAAALAFLAGGLTTGAGACAAAPIASPPVAATLTASRPAGFDALMEPQQAVADLYYHGEMVGQARIWKSPGGIRFDDVDAVIALLPDVIDRPAVRAALGGISIDPHVDLVCERLDSGQDGNCGRLPADQTGVIFDQRHFRIDLFVASAALAVRGVTAERYLTPSSTAPALVGFLSGTLAGSGGEHGYADVDLQTRLIASRGDARLRAEASYDSNYGIVADTLVAELDRPGVRYSAGEMWVPGLDLIGRRKLLGVGVRSQLDTRLDRDVVIGSPLVVSLLRRSRVDIIRDGRLLSSRIYEAGNQTLDTSAMPDGAYQVVLRIQEAGGQTREEQRFFSKNTAVPALGQHVFYAYGGLLADTVPHRLLSVTRIPYVQAGGALRLDPHIAIDATAIATNHTAIVEAGIGLLGASGQLRLAGLASARRDLGLIVQANSSGLAKLNYSIDARQVWSPSGRALLPSTDIALSGIDRSATLTEIAVGSFTEASGNLSYRLGRSQIGVTATYRHDAHGERYYSIGPTATMPLVQRQGVQVYLRGDATLSNHGRAAFLGISFSRVGAHGSLSANAGVRSTSGTTGADGTGAVGGVAASWQRDDVLGAAVAVAGGVDHDIGTTVARGRADVITRAASISADLLQPLGHDSGDSGAAQFSANAATSFSIGGGQVVFDGRRHDDSMIIVSVDGAPRQTLFTVLVDGTPRGTVPSGGHLAVSVPAYRRYAVRIVPTGDALLRIDGGTRQVGVFPGSVVSVNWHARAVLAMFGRLIWSDGTPVIGAAIAASGEIAQSDEHGFFQIEAAAGAEMIAKTADGRTCNAILKPAAMESYAMLGTIRCAAPLPRVIIARAGE